jgi:hypothetical protein
MAPRALPPVAAVVSFIDRINHGDVDGLGRLMTDDHVLVVFSEAPVRGRDANVAGWRGYVDAHPAYVIHPRRIAERDGRVAVLGHTTGSHLALPPEAEVRHTLIWVADVTGGRLRSWSLVDDTREQRARLGLDGV